MLRSNIIIDKEKAIKVLCDNQGILYRVAYKYSKDKHKAEDLVQTAFLKILKNCHNFEGTPTNALNLGITVIIRTFFTELESKRSLKRRYTSMLSIENLGEFLELEAYKDTIKYSDFDLSEELTNTLHCLINKVPKLHKQYIIDRVFYNFTHKQLAAKYSISHEKSKTFLFNLMGYFRYVLRDNPKFKHLYPIPNKTYPYKYLPKFPKNAKILHV